MNINDDGKLRTKINNKKYNARKEEIGFFLTRDNIEKLLSDAHILSSQWTHRQFHLARYNDIGNYEIGNCRFILGYDNYKERKLSAKAIASSKINVVKMNNKDNLLELQDKGRTNSKKWERRLLFLSQVKKINRFNKLSKMNKSFIGDKNSQFGTYWITDGSNNQKWRSNKGDFPSGFHLGRTIG